MKAAMYIRVSTEEQAQEGFSIEAQKKVLDAYAVIKGYDDLEFYIDEGFSAKNLNRPQVRRLMEDCRQGKIQTVLVWRLDRLSRSLRDTLDVFEDVFRGNGIDFISTSESIDTSTTSGRLMLNVLASFAQNEREVIEERVRMVSCELAKEAVHLGGLPPFGYRVVDRHYVIEPLEGQAVHRVFERYVNGLGYDAILRYLNGEGFKTPRGNPFRKTTLYDILGNEKYVGTYVYNRTISANRAGKRNNHANKGDAEIIRVPGGVPAIIDEVTWKRACELRLHNRHVSRGAYIARHVYLLSGITVCGVCGAHINGASMGKDRNGTIQRYYHCKHKDVRRVRKEKLERYVLDFLKLLATDETIVAQSIEVMNAIIESESSAKSAEEVALQAQLADIEKRIANMIDFIASGGQDAPLTLMDTVRDFEKKKVAISTALEAAKARSNAIDAGQVMAMFQTILDIENSPMEQQKAAIHRAVAQVRLYDDRFEILADNALCGGGEGSRTPVRKSVNQAFSERSRCFRIPPATRPYGRLAVSVASSMPVTSQSLNGPVPH